MNLIITMIITEYGSLLKYVHLHNKAAYWCGGERDLLGLILLYNFLVPEENGICFDSVILDH